MSHYSEIVDVDEKYYTETNKEICEEVKQIFDRDTIKSLPKAQRKRLRSKYNKLKKSSKKRTRQNTTQLSKQCCGFFNSGND